MWICNTCGAENHDESTTCVHCGQNHPDLTEEYPQGYVGEDGYAPEEEPVSEYTPEYEEQPYEADVPVQEERPRPKKKRSKFQKFMRKLVKRLRRFGNNVAELPSATLLILGGGIALLLIIIILLVILVPKLKKPAAEVVATPEPTIAVSTPEPVIEETPEPTQEPVVTPHPMDDLELEDGRTYLKSGDTADVVAQIQQRLIDLGYMETPVVDGVAAPTKTFGKTTKKAVRQFQYINDITCDGTVGRQTYDVLMSDSAKEFKLSGAFDHNLFEDEVKKMQTALIGLGYLSGTASGNFDDATVAAVRSFQTNNGLTSDGVAGRETLKVLYGGNAKKA